MPRKSPLAPPVFRRNLLAWFRRNRRDFPWRRTSDPYVILVSEIMLQQTQTSRVADVLPRWIAAFPTFHALAKAAPAQVLRAWSGLGYNRRALMLHACARAVVRDHGGVLPTDVVALRALPGIGSYTANAVRAFAFNLPSAAVDVNVLRVLQRATHPAGAFTADDAAETLARIVTRSNSRTLHSALMDFGATTCRATPLCASCPMEKTCPSAHTIRAPLRRSRSGDETPRRIYRGRVLRYLTTNRTATVAALLAAAAPGESARDAAWMHTVLDTLVRDGLVEKAGGGRYQLPEGRGTGE